MAATATTIINLVYGQWTQVGAVGDQPIIAPNARGWKLLLRYQNTDPGVGVVTGHPRMEEKDGYCMACVPSATFQIWARPIYPEADMSVVITRV